MKTDLENLHKLFDEYWHNTGSGISPKIGEELCQYSERVARDAFIQGVQQRTDEELQKQRETEKAKFGFRTKMPVGSVWLGNLIVNSWDRKTITFVSQNGEEMPATIYHAHQIVKAAQEYTRKYGWAYELSRALEAAEQDGVLQNLE